MAQPNVQPAATTEKLRWNNNTCWIVLSYIGVLIHGLIGLSVVKEDDRVRFHCAQSVALSVAFILLQILFAIIQAIVVAATIATNPWQIATGASVVAIINSIVSLAYLGFVIFIIVKAFGGTDFRVPFFADFADKYLVKLFNKK